MMNETRARHILGGMIQEDDSLMKYRGVKPDYYALRYVRWVPGQSNITLDDEFTADELEAFAWWMRNKNGSTKKGGKNNGRRKN